MEQQIEPPQRVATALLYGIETEMSGYPREASALDDKALLYLYPLADKDMLARIRNARLPQSYFECLLQALQSSFIYDRLIISWVNELPQPELAAEVVDFLIRFEEVDWAVCAGVLRGQADFVGAGAASRTPTPARCCAQVVGRPGRAGGHDRRAGGTISLPSTSRSAVEDSAPPSCVAGCSRLCGSTSAVDNAWCRAARCCTICKHDVGGGWWMVDGEELISLSTTHHPPPTTKERP